MIYCVSTHADDCIFSAGEFVARQTSEGEEVVIVNVCSTAFMYDLEGQEWQRVLNAEHVAACRLLGAEPAFGNRQDGKWGTPLSEQNLSGLFLADLVKEKPDIFVMPLGIHHQDHLDVTAECQVAITKAWAGDWRGQVYVYEDLPYAALYPEEAHLRKMAMLNPHVEQVGNAGFLESKLAACAAYESQWGEDARRCCSIYERIWKI